MINPIPIPTLDSVLIEKYRNTISFHVDEVLGADIAGSWLKSKYLKYVVLNVEERINDSIFNKMAYRLSELVSNNVSLFSDASVNYKRFSVTLSLENNVEKILGLVYKFVVEFDMLALAVDYSLQDLNPALMRSFTLEKEYEIYSQGEMLSIEGVEVQNFKFVEENVSENLQTYIPCDLYAYNPREILGAFNPSNVGGFSSPLMVSVGESGDVRLLFFVNLRGILLERSKYKNLFQSNEELLKEVLENTRVLNVKVWRHRYGFESLESPELVVSGRENVDTAKSSLTLTNVGYRNSTAGILSYEVVDKRVLTNTDGRYWYSVEYEVEDGSVTLLSNKALKLRHIERTIHTDELVTRYQVEEYIKTLMMVTTIAEQDAGKLKLELHRIAKSASGKMFFKRLLRDLLYILDDLGLSQYITVTFSYREELVDANVLDKPTLSYITENGSAGLTRVDKDEARNASSPRMIHVLKKEYSNLESEYEQVAIDLMVSLSGQKNLVGMTEMYSLSFASMQTSYSQSEKTTNSALVLESSQERLQDSDYKDVFVSKLLKLPKTLEEFYERYGLKVKPQLFVGFREGVRRIETKTMVWADYTPELYEELRARGLVLCRLVGEKGLDFTTYNQYCLIV